MGSCEDSTSFDEPLQNSSVQEHQFPESTEHAALEKIWSLEDGGDLVDSNVDTSNNAPQKHHESTMESDIDCVVSGDVTDSPWPDCADGLIGKCENVGSLGAENLLNDSGRVSEVCSEQGTDTVTSTAEIDVSCLDNAVRFKDQLKECRSGVDTLSAETDCFCTKRLINGALEASGDSSIACMAETENCEVRNDQLCLETGKSRGEDGAVNLLQHFTLCAGIPTNDLLLDYVWSEKLYGTKNASDLPEEEKSLDDGCGASGEYSTLVTCEAGGKKVQTSPLCLAKEGSKGEDGSVNLLKCCRRPTEVLQQECVQDEERSDKSGISALPEEGLMEDNSCLASLYATTEIQPSPSIVYETPSEWKPMSNSPQYYLQEDEHASSLSSADKLSLGKTDGVVKDQSDVLVEISKDAQEQIFPPQNCEVTSESVFVHGLPGNFIREEGQEDDKSVNVPSAETVYGATKEPINFSANMTSDGQNIMIHELASESIHVTCPIGYIDGQEDDENTNCLSEEAITDVMAEKADTVSGAETASQISEVLSELFLSTGSQNNRAVQDKQEASINVTGHSLEQKIELQEEKNHFLDMMDTDQRNEHIELNSCNAFAAKNDVNGEGYALCTKAAPSSSSCAHDLICASDMNSDHKNDSELDGVVMKGVTEPVIVTSPGHDLLQSVKNLHMVDKPRNSSQEEEQMDDGTVVPSENFTGVMEEKSDLTKVSCSTEVLPSENFTGAMNDGTAVAVASNCSIEKSGSLNFFGQMEFRDNLHAGADRVSETKCPGAVSSSSRRNSRGSKSKNKTAPKKTARNSKNKSKVSGLCQDIEITARRKRSCVSRQARSSLWGLLSNAVGYFDHYDELKISQSQNQGLPEVKGTRGSRKRNKKEASGNLQGSIRKCDTLNSGLRLRVKLGNGIILDNLNAVIPEAVNVLASVDAIYTDCKTGLEFPELDSKDINKLGKEENERHFQGLKDGTKAIADTLFPDVHVECKDEDNVITNKVVDDTADDCLMFSSNTTVEALDKIMESRYIDPGTSPDSEVINLVPDVQVGVRDQGDLHYGVNSSKSVAVVGDVTSSKRVKKKEKLPLTSNSTQEVGKPGSTSTNKAKSSKKHGGLQKIDIDNCFNYSEVLSSATYTEASSNSLNGTGLADALPSYKSEGHLISKGSKSKKARKAKAKAFESGKSRKGDGSRQNGDQGKLHNKSKDKREVACNQEGYTMDGCIETGNQVTVDIRNRKTGDEITVDMVFGGVMEQVSPPDSAWVSCDGCHKWRRISVDLANSLGEDCRWVCEDNVDEAYASCSIPQEKSNADINAELGISDAEEDAYDGQSNHNRSKRESDCRRVTIPQKAFFQRIDTNEFLHRKHKTQTIDEVMVCHCKAPQNGQLGCGDECLNRMLNIECVPGTCPCGDLCSNQLFQKRNYANMDWSRSGKKGYGLKVLEDISEGQFLIEYVGEVLDTLAYEERQKEYALSGHKHFYFMTLNGSEVIDAGAKGNLGRFINHSCDPNCRTEKWMVNGEICVGLFALRKIKKDEELTFDYNYVRVFGAAAKKCFCGASCCQGYIGGGPHNTEDIVQGDSDDEFPEPVMLVDGVKQVISRARSSVGTEIKIQQGTLENQTDKFSKTVGELEVATEIDNSLDQSALAVSELQSSVEIENLKSVEPLDVSTVVEDVTSKHASTDGLESMTLDKTKEALSTVLKLEASVRNDNPSSDGKRIFRKSRFLLKTPNPSGSVKKGKVSSTLPSGNKVKIIANKPELQSAKPKKLVAGSPNGRFEAVQEKLNELLNADGGVSKRKDAAKGYLKLLLLTAASGDSGNSEAIQSNRDLSMILDALLKTKSRLVLTDIINKNGLQMLHNTMKQIRRNFKRIPILRKLLKVLEYLAVREILTLERIVGGPLCHGIESFRESILSLCEHDDKQVHQISRNFRDRWIPRSFRRFGYLDRDDGRGEFHRNSNSNGILTSPNHRRDPGITEQGAKTSSEANDHVMQSMHATTSLDSTVGCSTPTTSCSTDGVEVRKRKSRWDQPAPPRKEQKVDQLQSATSPSDTVPNLSCNHDDVPPGFSPVNALKVSSNITSTAPDVVIITGYPQQKFINRMPVSYGIPFSLIQQFGTSHADIPDSWAVAPSMPFYPFPPLPAYPREPIDVSACGDTSFPLDEPPQQGMQDSFEPEARDENIPKTNLLNTDFPGGNAQQQSSDRAMSHDLSRRYYKQQKWNKGKNGPPWNRKRNYPSPVGNNSRSRTCGGGEGNVTVTNELGPYCPEDMSYNNTCNEFYQQHPQQQNYH